MALLEIKGLAVAYGRIRAVRDVSLTVGEGEIVALIGANGAGKSSTMNAVTGVVRPRAGHVRFAGADITGLPAHRAIRLGVAQVPEGRMIFRGLTVEENLLVGARGSASLRQRRAKADELLALFPALRERLEERAAVLSGGQLQMLALARGLMAEPRLLMLDEPSLGLAPVAAKEVFALVRDLGARGLPILLVEQNVRQALAIADRGYVIEGGRIILEGAADALLHDELLVNSYLGIGGAGTAS